MISLIPTFFPIESSLFKTYFHSLKIVLLSVLIGYFLYKGYETITDYSMIINLIGNSTQYNEHMNETSNLTFHDRKYFLTQFINYDYEGTWKYENINNNSINGICYLTFRQKFSTTFIYYFFDIFLFDGNFNNHIYSISNLISYNTDNDEPFINRKNETEYIYDVSYDNIVVRMNEYKNLKNVNLSNSIGSNFTFTYDSMNRTMEGKIEIDNINITFDLTSTENNLATEFKNYNRFPLIVGILNVLYNLMILEALFNREYELIRVNNNISFI